MLKKTLIATAFAAATALAVSAPASADSWTWHWNGNNWHVVHWDNGWDRDGWRDDNRRDRHAKRHAPRQETLRARIDRRVVNGTLPLRRILGINSNYNGYRIESVTVKISPRHSRGGVRLIVDGRVADRHVGLNQRKIKLYPRRDDVIGREVGRLQLDVKGQAYINSVKVKLTKVRGHARKHSHKRAHKHAYGYERGIAYSSPAHTWIADRHSADQTP